MVAVPLPTTPSPLSGRGGVSASRMAASTSSGRSCDRRCCIPSPPSPSPARGRGGPRGRGKSSTDGDNESVRPTTSYAWPAYCPPPDAQGADLCSGADRKPAPPLPNGERGPGGRGIAAIRHPDAPTAPSFSTLLGHASCCLGCRRLGAAHRHEEHEVGQREDGAETECPRVAVVLGDGPCEEGDGRLAEHLDRGEQRVVR